MNKKALEVILLVLSALLVAAKTIHDNYYAVECNDKTE